jgi:hypothetical protein
VLNRALPRDEFGAEPSIDPVWILESTCVRSFDAACAIPRCTRILFSPERRCDAHFLTEK